MYEYSIKTKGNLLRGCCWVSELNLIIVFLGALVPSISTFLQLFQFLPFYKEEVRCSHIVQFPLIGLILRIYRLLLVSTQIVVPSLLQRWEAGWLVTGNQRLQFLEKVPLRDCIHLLNQTHNLEIHHKIRLFIDWNWDLARNLYRKSRRSIRGRLDLARLILVILLALLILLVLSSFRTGTVFLLFSTIAIFSTKLTHFDCLFINSFLWPILPCLVQLCFCFFIVAAQLSLSKAILQRIIRIVLLPIFVTILWISICEGSFLSFLLIYEFIVDPIVQVSIVILLVNSILLPTFWAEFYYLAIYDKVSDFGRPHEGRISLLGFQYLIPIFDKERLYRIKWGQYEWLFFDICLVGCLLSQLRLQIVLRK